MTITARYPGRCSRCGQPITIGQQIEWAHGYQLSHASCATTSPAPRRASSARRPASGRSYGRPRPGVVYASMPAVSRRLRDPKDGEQIIHRDTASYESGQTLHATRVPGGGGADGHYWTVVGAGSHRISETENDTREGDIRYDAIVRPATDTEATACARRISEAQTAQAARAEALRQIETGESQGRSWRAPAGSRTIATDPGRPGSLASYPYLLADPAGTVYHVRPVYDDTDAVRRLTLSVDEAITAARIAGWRITEDTRRSS